jgi:hypothetical protein
MMPFAESVRSWHCACEAFLDGQKCQVFIQERKWTMKKLFAGVVTTALMCTIGGCTKESMPGGQGAKTTTGTNNNVDRSYRTPDGEDTFSLTVPRTETNIEQGERQDVTISVKRGSRFNELVTLTFKAPQGITVTPLEVTMNPGDKEAQITIEASSDAKLGKTHISVMGTPQAGKAVSIDLPVEVKERD